MMKHVLVVAMAVLLCLAGDALANKRNPNKNTNTNNRNNRAGAPQLPSDAQVKSADKEAATAKSEVVKASSAVNLAAVDLHRTFETSADYKAAADAKAKAQTDYETARAPVLEALKAKPEYLAAKGAKDRAEQERDALATSETASIAQKSEAATIVMNTGTVVTRLEGDALAADPKVTDARNRLVDANNRLSQLEKDFEASLKNDPKWQAAKASLDQAKSKEEQTRTAAARAHEEYNRQLGTYRQQLAQWNQQQQQQQQQINNRTTPRR